MRALVNPLLARLGIDTHQFWLLSGLFHTLAARRELYGQLGREGVLLQTVMLLYGGFAAIGAMLWSLAQPPASVYLSGYLLVSGFLLFSILLAEAGNSLVNATEALVLAHRPIRGATYTAAKLSHLGTLVAKLTLAINAIPALIGLTLPDAGWLYPLLHTGLTLALGLVCALTCCALYGALLRLLPPQRIKTVSSIVEGAPLVLMAFGPPLFRQIRKADWLPRDPPVQQGLLAALAVAALLGVIFGLRSLSTDFLLRVATVVHGGRARTVRIHLPWSPGSLAAAAGGQPARAAFAYMAIQMRRDYQFQRQLLSLLAAIVIPFGGVLSNLQQSPFQPSFTAAHALPHICGFALFLICSALPYGNQPKAAWIFQLAPRDAWPRFAQGIHLMLWTWLVALPHAIVLAVALYYWPLADALLFTGYSLALASLYLAATLLLVEYVPFSRPMQPERGAMLLPAMLIGGVFVAIAMALQFFLIFRVRLAVPVATIAMAAAAWLGTRYALRRLAVDMQFGIAQDTGEVTGIYTEVN